MQHTRLLFLLLIAWTFPTGLLWAEDAVYLRSKDKPLWGVVKNETGAGFLVDKTAVPAEDVIDILYDPGSSTFLVDVYQPAWQKEKDSQEKEANRQENIEEAIARYEKILPLLKPAHENIRRNIEFRLGVLHARLTLEFRAPPAAALTRLTAFKTAHPNSWQIAQCLRLLAAVQTSQNQLDQAEKTLLELSKSPVSDEVKAEAELQAAQLGMSAKNYDQALAKLQALAARQPRNSRQARRVSIVQAECLFHVNKAAEANKILRSILKDSSDNGLKAMAHNTLGKILYEQSAYKEARWEFLWVDVVYNQDRAEHAKALYYLAHTFEKLGDADRARECRELLAEHQFAGLEYQRRMQTESK